MKKTNNIGNKFSHQNQSIDQLDEDLWHPVVESTIKPAVMSEIPSVADLGLKCFGKEKETRKTLN